MDRRTFVRRSAIAAASAAGGVAGGVGAGFWQRVLAAPAVPGPSPYGPLQGPDANGVRLPAGFTSRVVANSLLPVPGTDHRWHPFPDGGGCVPTDDGGWIYVSNSEYPFPVDMQDGSQLLAIIIANVHAAGGEAAGLLPLPTGGGVGAIRFAPDGTITGAYPILTGSSSNCAGGLTPWGTWLSCEEWESKGNLGGYSAGLVWECDPFGVRPAVARPALGRFRHEMATCDPVRQQLYLSEDQINGLLYRYTPRPGTWGTGDALVGGTLEALRVSSSGATTWLPVAAFTDPAEPHAPLREIVAGAATFNGGEGCLYDDGRVYLTTKGDERVWVHDIEAQTMDVLYDRSAHADAPLGGVDNLAVSAVHDLYVAEDGDDLQVCTITADGVVAPVVQLTGPQHGFDSGTQIPLASEITGLALSPDGNRLYLGSERGMGLPGVPAGPGPGILYEITGPFRGGTLAAAATAAAAAAAAAAGRAPAPGGPAPAAPAPVGHDGDGRMLPATGAGVPVGAATVAGVAGAALLRLRTRLRP